MSDDLNNKSKRPNGADRQLRRARDRFGSRRTQLALNEAILSVPGTTVFDAERIITQLDKRLGDFKYIEGFKWFRFEVVAWVTRQATLTVKVREMLADLFKAAAAIPGCNAVGHVVSLIFDKLPDYDGDVLDSERFREWAIQTAKRQAEGIVALATWIKIHSSAVRAGIWKVLADCRDLEGCIDDVAEELFSTTWEYVTYHAAEFLEPAEALPNRLYLKGYWLARAWKTKRLDEIRTGIRPKPVPTDGLEELESRLAYYAGSGKLPPRPVVLGTGDSGAFEPIHPDLFDLESYDIPIDTELPVAA